MYFYHNNKNTIRFVCAIIILKGFAKLIKKYIQTNIQVYWVTVFNFNSMNALMIANTRKETIDLV